MRAFPALPAAVLAAGCCAVLWSGSPADVPAQHFFATPAARSVTSAPPTGVALPRRAARPPPRATPAGTQPGPESPAAASPSGAAARLSHVLLAASGVLAVSAAALLRRARHPRPDTAFVLLSIAAPDATEDKAVVKFVVTEDTRLRTVVLARCPVTITEEDLRRQFPRAAAVKVVRNGGALGAQGLLQFPSVEEAQAVVVAEGLQVKGHPVFARMEAPNRKVFLKEENARSVMLSDLPLTTTKEDLKKLFPTCADVRLVRTNDQFKGMAFVVLPTPREAVEAAATVGLAVQGQTVTIALAERKSAEIQERNLRTVLLSGCPETITVEQLRRQFPTVEQCTLLAKWAGGPPTGRCFLRFPSVAAAQAVVDTPGLQVGGLAVRANIVGSGEQQRLKEEESRQVLLSSCPMNATAMDFHALFPAAEQIRLLPKGGPFGGRCFVLFRTQEEAQAVLAMEKVEVLGQRVVVRMAKDDSVAFEQEEAGRTAVLYGCPEDTTPQQLREQFPSVEAIRLAPKYPGGPFSGRAFLVFPTVAAAEAVVNTLGLQVNGQPVRSAISGVDRDRYLEEQNARSVVLEKMALGTLPRDILQVYPNAEEIRGLRNRKLYFVTFRTLEEARAAVEDTSQKLKGKPFIVRRVEPPKQGLALQPKAKSKPKPKARTWRTSKARKALKA